MAFTYRPIHFIDYLDEIIHYEYVFAAHRTLTCDRPYLSRSVIIVHLCIELFLDLVPHEISKHFSRRIYEMWFVKSDVVFPRNTCHLIQ